MPTGQVARWRGGAWWLSRYPLKRSGMRASHCHLASLGSVGLCFVGLWPPVFWLIGDSLAR